MLRQGEGEPLVLLHGIIASERFWVRVIPKLADEFDVIAPTMLGHRGGRAPTSSPTEIWDLVLAVSARFRRRTLANSVVRGERVSRAEYVGWADDAIECVACEDLLRSKAALAPIDPPPCPIALAWSGEDRIFPVDRYGAKARELIPGAEFDVLEGVGHVPMADDPQLVADTIRATAARAR